MIVVDVNAIAYLWIPGEMTDVAERALERDADWVSPILWRSEFRNILAIYVRRGGISQRAADESLRKAEAQMEGREHLVPSHLVMREVYRSACSAYDCEYVALARDLEVKLVTSDGQILREFPRLAVGLVDFAEGGT